MDKDQAQRLKQLRAELKNRKLDGFIIPRSDEHQGEDVPACSERLFWLTGFTGSAGQAVVTNDRAAIFIDGRYTLQVQGEVPADLYEYRHLITEPATTWIEDVMSTGQRIGYDPWLMTRNQVVRFRNAAQAAGAELVAEDTNPIDAVWADRPLPPKAAIAPHDIRYTGKESSEKRAEIAEALSNAGQDAAVLAAPDSIAWLLNVRGGDLPNSPQPLSFAIVHNDARVDWFVDPDKPAEGLGQFLGTDVQRADPDQFGSALDQLGKTGATVRVNGDSEPHWVGERLRGAGATIEFGADPCALPKAIKTHAELDGTRQAHHRDGVTMVRFLHWLDGVLAERSITEIEASDKLEEIRKAGENFRGLSFPTISGFGANGASPHYRASEQSAATLVPGSLYLVDSGGQYLDGTTDVTRTVPVGEPTSEMCENFTRVLKGHIAVATAKFPTGTTGSQIDPFARKALWDAGLDYDHGTGHGVGSYLNVHEGPHRISKAPNTVALVPGMIVSNEPGYYKAGAYGIRIENLVAVTTVAALDGAERDMLGFETLTMAPIDLRLVVPGLLDATEIAWLNSYHVWVSAEIMPHVDEEQGRWLQQATRPI
jgi:Xaa-Pro aminopeptidase